MNLAQYTTPQIAELRGQTRMNVAALTNKGALRTVDEEHELAEQRSLLRRLTREIKSRITQPPLF